MDSGSVEWWRRHGWTIGLLLVAFGFAFAIRTIWQYPIIQQFGALYTYAGGSDSYYHSRVMTYIIQTHRNLVWDPMLKYPVGAVNPREPLFDWMNAILGIVFAPFFGGNAVNAGAWFLDLQSPLWAALCVFPLYLIGREISGRRTGLIAALVYPFFPASIDSSTFGYADYLSFYTFFLLVVVYAYLRMLKAVGHRRWVESYRRPRELIPAIRSFLRTERTAVKWSVFTGVSLGAFALVWQGYTYAIVVIAFTVLIAMLIERIRRVDSFGLYISTWIIGLIAFPMAGPYYLVQGVWRLFLELPVILFFGTLLLLLPFLFLRDVPWVFSIPALLAVVGAGVLALRFLSPSLFASAITGNGYFVKTLVYSTVAEAQAPSIDSLIVGYGVVTFFLAFAGLALFAYLLVHHRFKRYHIAFLIFAVVSVYLPISAAKFFLVASPAFALLSAEGIHRLLDVGAYAQLRRSVASLSDRSGSLSAFRKSFKPRHVLVLVLAVGILLPNIWIAVDAGIPSNNKNQFADQINNTIPSWLKLNQSAPADDYLGAAGTGLDTSNQYDSAGYNWLAQQDSNVPEPERPALVSWWDYGFQTIDQGQHPSVADNFQNGIDPAGQFLLAQNESLAIAVLATTLLQGEIQLSHQPNLPASLNAMLTRDNVNVSALHRYLNDEAWDYQLVVGNPQTFLPVDPSTITDDNAMYLATSNYLASHLTLGGVSTVYNDLEAYTGWSIRYALTDSRLIPFTGSDTGIFYAPADLTGRVINSAGVPTSYYNVTILGSDGVTYPLGPLPSGVSAEEYNINWSAPYYNSMIYRIYFGYNGTDIGLSGGIPGLTGAAESSPVEPGWMLQHFEVEYQTAYVCAGVKNASDGAPCMVATNKPTALEIANKTGGTADTSAFSYFDGGESILAYYSGVTLYGRVLTPSNQPVPGARVTVYDSQNIPHMTNVTTANGTFTLVLPPGNDTVKISYGTLNLLTEAGENVIASVPITIPNALGFDPTPPALDQTFTVGSASVAGQVFWNISANGTYIPSVDPVVRGAQVLLTNEQSGTVISATSDASGAFSLSAVPPGGYSVRVRYDGQTFNESSTNISAGASVTLELALDPGKVTGVVSGPEGGLYLSATVTLTNASGGLQSVVTNSTGSFAFDGLAPGTYGLSAIGLTPALSSGRVAVTIGSGGASVVQNLTLLVGGTAEVALSAAGLALPNATVTFTPVVSFTSSSGSAIGAILAAATNTTLATAGPTGVAAAHLPVGVYSVSATARVSGVTYSALGALNVTGAGATPTLSLTLSPSRTLTVAVPGTGLTGSRTAVLAYGPGGSQALGWAGENGSAVIRLPSGSYTFLVVRGNASTSANTAATLRAVTVTGSTTLSAPLSTASVVRFSLGTPGSSGGLIPAAGGTVVLSVGSTTAAVPEYTNATGAVGFVVPETPTGAAGGYCLAASAFGFNPASQCGYTSEELANLSQLPLPLTVTPVPVTLGVVGLPSGTPVTINITGESVAANNLTLSGGPTFAFSLNPGVYGVGARATIDHGTTVYLPSGLLSTTIPLGATYSKLTLIVIPQINATGNLSLPDGAAASTATVTLSSPTLNLTVNGAAYVKSFRAATGVYTATVNATINGLRYVNISRVTVYANGTVWPKLVASQVGGAAKISLTGNDIRLDANTTLTLVNSAGLRIVVPIVEGAVNTTLPGGKYLAYANATVLTSGPNGSYYTAWTSNPGANCTLNPPSPSCSVPMTGTVLTVTLQGTLTGLSGSTPVAGSVRLVGPYPSTSLTVLSAGNGTFSASVLPGAYYVYATASAVPLATFGRLLALPGGDLNVTIPLLTARTDQVQLSVLAPTTLNGTAANVTVRDVFGDVTTFPGVPIGGSVQLQLPSGVYLVSASAPGARNGVAGTANASARVLLASGNAVTALGLAVPILTTVSSTLVGPTSATVAAGGSTTFSFTVRNSGNEPVTFHPVGSPSGWTFAFSFGNVTLTPGQSLSGEVRVTLPTNAAVDHGPLAFTFVQPNGTAAGTTSPAPVVNVVAFYGIAAGASAVTAPQVGSTHAILPFYLTDTGNAPETVQLSIVNLASLTEKGWATDWLTGAGSTPSGIFSLTGGENLSVSLNLTPLSNVLVPPGRTVVQAIVLNVTGTLVASFILTVPAVALATSPGTLHVTGPSVTGAPGPIPVWFVPLIVFVPAIALVVAVVTYRWWRTRRWTRR